MHVFQAFLLVASLLLLSSCGQGACIDYAGAEKLYRLHRHELDEVIKYVDECKSINNISGVDHVYEGEKGCASSSGLALKEVNRILRDAGVLSVLVERDGGKVTDVRFILFSAGLLGKGSFSTFEFMSEKPNVDNWKSIGSLHLLSKDRDGYWYYLDGCSDSR